MKTLEAEENVRGNPNSTLLLSQRLLHLEIGP